MSLLFSFHKFFSRFKPFNPKVFLSLLKNLDESFGWIGLENMIKIHWVTQKLPQIYTANHATFPIRIRKITVQICGNFWVTQYLFTF